MFPPELIALAAVFAVNRLAIRAVALRAPLFWSLNALNLVAALLVAVFGISGVERFPVVNWLVVAMLAMHVALNLSIRNRMQWDREKEAKEKEVRRQALEWERPRRHTEEAITVEDAPPPRPPEDRP